MQRLPFALSIPHGGWAIPPEIADMVVATEDDQREDIDHLTRELFLLPDELVAHQVRFDVARTFVDLNRAPDQWGPLYPDGVVKMLTHADQPIFSTFPPDEVVLAMLDRLYYPYHATLAALVADPEIVLLLDCHSMAPRGLTVSPDYPGQARPLINLGHRGGASAPVALVETLREVMAEIYEIPLEEIAIDHPFNGGHITNTHSNASSHAIQIEFNRAFYLGDQEGKTRPVLESRTMALWQDRFRRTLELLHARAFAADLSP